MSEIEEELVKITSGGTISIPKAVSKVFGDAKG